MTTEPTTTELADAAIPAGHPLAEHLAHARAVRAAGPHRSWTPEDGPLPAIYLSHGSPMTFEDGPWMRELHDWAQALPRPKAVVIVSAHWERAPLSITSTEPTELVYDFGGFAPMYYSLRYDTPPTADVAQRLVSVLPDTTTVHEHRGRGLDHGAWVPLKAMYPEADVPVVQMSIPTHDPGTLVGLGARLRPLREDGVLVIGSGFMTHGLPFVNWHDPSAVPGWSRDFDDWAKDALDRGDLDELSAYRDRAPGLPYAHPTVEHFTPLFVTLGASSDPSAPAETVIDGFTVGLAKRSVQVA